LDWIPFGVGKAICALIEDVIAAIVGLALLPAILATFENAWDAAQAFDDQFATGPVAQQIHVGDVIVVTGRWVWDGAHAGNTELHPVKTIQKVFGLDSDLQGGHDPGGQLHPEVVQKVADVRDRWCSHVSEAPPPPLPGETFLSAPQVASLSPKQRQIYDRQRQPEQQWSLHPLIDGCEPAQEPIA
jgi:hypothetical protein